MTTTKLALAAAALLALAGCVPGPYGGPGYYGDSGYGGMDFGGYDGGMDFGGYGGGYGFGGDFGGDDDDD